MRKGKPSPSFQLTPVAYAVHCLIAELLVEAAGRSARAIVQRQAQRAATAAAEV